MSFVNKYIIFFAVLQLIFILFAPFGKSVFLVLLPSVLAFLLWIVGLWVVFIYFIIKYWWKDNH